MMVSILFPLASFEAEKMTEALKEKLRIEKYKAR